MKNKTVLHSDFTGEYRLSLLKPRYAIHAAKITFTILSLEIVKVIICKCEYRAVHIKSHFLLYVNSLSSYFIFVKGFFEICVVLNGYNNVGKVQGNIYKKIF